VSKKRAKQVFNEADVEVIDDDVRDEDYKGSDASSEAEELSQSYINEDEELDEETAKVEELEAQLETDPTQSFNAFMYKEHKAAFYRKYTPLYESAKCSTHLITNDKYDWILSMLQCQPQKRDPMNVRKARAIYELRGNVEHHCVFRDGKVVTTFERIFDVILQAHQKLGHARDVKKNKDTINEDMNYYGVPRVAVKCFVDTCSMVSG
jgi:hypothetical protein